MTPFKLTIGELFPDQDVIGQWVFSVTSLAEDIHALTRPQQQALEDGDLRAMIVHHRNLITRLYEARRLVEASETYPEIETFAGDLLHGAPGGFSLRRVYARPAPNTRSIVEDLYAQLRHRTVHYMRVGSDELRDVLRQHASLPARVVVSADGPRKDVWFQWVHAVTATELFGDLSDPEFTRKLNERGQIAGNISAAWMMVAVTAALLHARRLGIDPDRLGEIPAPPES